MATRKQIEANCKNAKRSTGPRTGAGKARSAMNSTRHGLLGEFHLIEGEVPQAFSRFSEEIRADLKPEGAVEEYHVQLFIENAWRLNRLENVLSALLANPESVYEMSLSELLNIITTLTREGGRAFDQHIEFRTLLNEEARGNHKAPATSQSKDGSAVDSQLARTEALLGASIESESLRKVFLKHLTDRLDKVSPAVNKAQPDQTPAETDGAEGEHGARPTDTAINTMALAFARHSEAVALALRYRNKIERSRDNALHELERRQAARQGQLVPAPEVVDVNVNFTGKDEDRN